MPKRASNKNSGDINQIALSIVEQATQQPNLLKNPAAVALGRLGGKKGGVARALKLTPEKRREIAQKAARKRWGAGDAKRT